MLTSIDYAKAFNRLSFQHCLRAFEKKGASNQILRLLATFLSDRTMQVRVGSTWSSPRSVTGSVPQGSILGFFLFNETTDDLEENSAYVHCTEAPDRHDSFYDAPPDRSPGAFSDGSHSSDDSFHSALDVQDDPEATDFVFSTPVAGLRNIGSGPDISPVNTEGLSDRRRPNRPRRIIYSSEGDVTTPPPEPTATCLGQWVVRPVEVDKYVDDNLQEEAVNLENATVSPDGLEKMKHAIPTQNVFRHVIRRAEERGMKVNTAKTNMICVSDCLNHMARSYILDSDGNRIESSDKMKILGWHFSSKPTVEAHVNVLKRRFRERYWILRHLKHNGFSESDLLRVYTVIVRPVADYMMEIYHSMLTDAQDEAIERLQTHALKCIFSPKISGRRLRALSGLTTLRERRIQYCDKFAEKCVRNPRFEHWFSERKLSLGRQTRSSQKYEEEFARCDRLYYSPVFYMRRRLNGKP